MQNKNKSNENCTRLSSIPIFISSSSKKIQEQIKLSKKIIIESIDDNYHHAYHINNQSNLYDMRGNICSCNLTVFAGFPCCHLIKLYDIKKLGFPFEFVSPRWIKNNSTISISNKKSINEDDYFTDNQNIEEEDEEEEIKENINDIENIQSETQKGRYLILFHKGKELAKLGCQNQLIF